MDEHTTRSAPVRTTSPVRPHPAAAAPARRTVRRPPARRSEIALRAATLTALVALTGTIAAGTLVTGDTTAGSAPADVQRTTTTGGS